MIAESTPTGNSLLLDWLRKQMYFHGMVNLKRTFRTIPFYLHIVVYAF